MLPSPQGGRGEGVGTRSVRPPLYPFTGWSQEEGVVGAELTSGRDGEASC